MSHRVAVVGYGLAGRVFHAPLVRATPGLEVAVVVTGDPGRSARARHDFPAAEVVPDADRLFDRPDLVVVATPNRAHVPLARRSVEAGIPVVVDKPLAATAGDARRLVEEAEAAGVLLTVFQNRRWDGDFLTVRQLVGEGRLGRVHRFESRFERWRPDVRTGAWREDPDPAGAGGQLVSTHGIRWPASRSSRRPAAPPGTGRWSGCSPDRPGHQRQRGEPQPRAVDRPDPGDRHPGPTGRMGTESGHRRGPGRRPEPPIMYIMSS